MTVKTNLKTLLAATLAASAVASTATATTIVVNDTFDVGVTPFDDVSDPLDIGWTPISNAPTQVNVNTMVGAVGDPGIVIGSGNVLDEVKNGTFGGIRGALPTNSLLTLGVGDKVTVTFDLALFDAPGGPATGAGNGAGFRWGFFDAAGYGAFAQTGVGSDAANNGHRVRRDGIASLDDLMAGGSLAEFDGPNDVVNLASMPNPLQVNVAYDAEFIAERIALDTMQYTATINGTSAISLDVDDAGDPSDNLFDYSGGFFVIRTGNAQSDIRIDNFKVEVVPEPTAAVFAGLGGLMLVRRRAGR